jgi:hypothetical protein
MISLHVAFSMLLAFSMPLGIYSTDSASHQLEDYIPTKVNDVAAANPFLSSVSSNSASKRSYDIAEFNSQANLDGYMAFSYYRSDRGVVFCGGAFVYADTYKLNTCNAVAFSYGGYAFKSVMIVANSTTQSTRHYKDTKCQNLVDIDAATYTAGVCVTGGTDLSLITSISTKMSTDLTVPRVTRT